MRGKLKYGIAMFLACAALVALALFLRTRENARFDGHVDGAQRNTRRTSENASQEYSDGPAQKIEVRTVPKSDTSWTIRVLGEDGEEIRVIRGAGDTDLAFALRGSDWQRMEIRAPEHLGEIMDRKSLSARGVVPLQLCALGAVRVHVTHRGNPVAGVPISIRYLGRPNTDAVPEDDRYLYEKFLRVTVRVLREGKPTAGATIKLQRFGAGMPRMSVFWGQTNDRGTLEITGLPLDCKGVSGWATEGGQGRMFEVRIAGAREPHDIDLGP